MIHGKTLALVAAVAGLAGCGEDPLSTGASPILYEPMRLDSAPVCTESSHRGTFRLQLSPVLAVDDAGRAVAAWRQCDGHGLRVAAAWFDGKRWSRPTTLGRTPAIAPVAALSRAAGMIFWRETPDGQDPTAAYYSLLDERRGWGETRRFEPDDDIVFMTALDGGRTLVWSGGRPRSTLRASRFWPASGWTPAQAPRHHDDYLTYSHVVGDAAGNALAVFVGPDPGGTSDVQRPWVVRFDAQTGWDSPRPLDTAPRARAVDPTPALNEEGEGYVAWEDGYQAIQVARYTRGRGWTPPMRLDTGVSPRFSHPDVIDLSADARGGAHLLWEQAGELEILATRLAEGGQEGTSVVLGQGHSARVIARPDGAALAAWQGYDTGREPSSIHVRRYVVGRGWTSPETFTGAGGRIREFESRSVQMGVDGQGQAFLLWVEDNAGRDEVWVRRFR